MAKSPSAPRLPRRTTKAKEHEPSEHLSVSEKRRLLAQTVRMNVMDYVNEEGEFDVAAARRTLPGCSVQEFTVEEVVRTDRSGAETLKRKIRLHFVDKLRALDQDSALAGHKRAAPAPDEAQPLDEEGRAAAAQHARAALQLWFAEQRDGDEGNP